MVLSSGSDLGVLVRSYRLKSVTTGSGLGLREAADKEPGGVECRLTRDTKPDSTLCRIYGIHGTEALDLL